MHSAPVSLNLSWEPLPFRVFILFWNNSLYAHTAHDVVCHVCGYLLGVAVILRFLDPFAELFFLQRPALRRKALAFLFHDAVIRRPAGVPSHGGVSDFPRKRIPIPEPLLFGADRLMKTGKGPLSAF